MAIQVDRDSLRPLHNAALADPLHVLDRASEHRFLSHHLPLAFSTDRGNLPVLGITAEAVDDLPIIVLANSGAQLMNSADYPDRRSLKTEANFFLENERTVGPSMISYTKPGDTLVFSTENPEISLQILSVISDAYKEIGIELTDQVIPVASVDEWLEGRETTEPILPHVLDPEFIARYFPHSKEETREALTQLAFANVAAYTKNGAQLLWSREGIPTPQTEYYKVAPDTARQAASAIQTRFEGYSHVVVNRTDGSGGFGMKFLPKEEVLHNLSDALFQGQDVQVQGLLPTVTSPCLIANIHPNGSIERQLVSQQIFAEPGVHAGNLWHARDVQEFSDLSPDFLSVNDAALQALRDAGVVGQINIDSLILDSKTAVRFKKPTTVMREANTRPAGSSVINRQRKGTIHGQPITIILTATNVSIPLGEFLAGDRLKAINTAGGGKIKAVPYNYDMHSQRAAISLCATEGVSDNELFAFQQAMIGYLKHGK